MTTTEIYTLTKDIHENAKAHGWWENERPFAEICALIHSELSEALEEYRAGRPMIYYPCNDGSLCVDDRPEEKVKCGSRPYDPNNPEAPCSLRSHKPEGIAVELADAVIRILDWYEHAGVGLIDEECYENRIARVYKTNGERLSTPELINECHNYIAQYYGDNGYSPRADDAVILIRCWLAEQGIDLWEVVRIKHEYNKTRPYKHGGKQC